MGGGNHLLRRALDRAHGGLDMAAAPRTGCATKGQQARCHAPRLAQPVAPRQGATPAIMPHALRQRAALCRT
ncbi:hypothetical protein F511_47318 [Dorcoceras hygrometricum]|uniref:Uncharacterized protein n=1 Tax=Dorcoceras hygrometricum TaxID=472368 RepID=A0A2Z6ZXN7_9LAMI|nr:hypothetical protein F511_47318 [Dorcoceras hygrometricum]